jgi:hypothetical protein
MDIRTSCDLEEAGRVWRELWQADDIFGCWEARDCFRKTFGRRHYFIIAESSGRPAGLLGLSHIEEGDYYGQYPGETWKGRTWFEQNRIPAVSGEVRRMLWEAAPARTMLRYVEPDYGGWFPECSFDETGYLFHPPAFGFDFDRYWSLFSGKSRKKIAREIESLGVLEYSQDDASPGDVDWMFETNRANFGPDSFFDDPRFLEGFEGLLSFLSEKDRLVITTVRTGGRLAAVDVGALYGRHYTLLAGATDPEMRGIAKAINLFHIRWGCGRRLERVDFLCGDFGWKERFHLEPRPLFNVVKDGAAPRTGAGSEEDAQYSVAC